MSTRTPYNAEAAGAQCSRCPLMNTGTVVPPKWGDALKAKAVALVSDSPGKWEVQKREQFAGPVGVRLDTLLHEAAGMRRSEVLLSTSAILCRPEVPGVEGKARYDVKRYMAYLRKENRMRKKHGFPEMPTPFECCAPRLGAELKWAERIAFQNRLGTRLVAMPLGSYALASLHGEPGKAMSIVKYRGSVIDVSAPPPGETTP